MLIGQRLREIREAKKLSQCDIQRLTGLLHSHISRIETGHTPPTLQTPEKYAHALEVPLYQFFYEEDKISAAARTSASAGGEPWGSSGRERYELQLFTRSLSRMSERDRKLLFAMATKMAAGDISKAKS